jgi:tetratricopeptide (TPR) repeat protein
MDKLTQNLLLHEIILMFLGVLLFIALLVILIVLVLRNRQIKVLLGFFILPIIMIAFPAIQSIKVTDAIDIVLKESQKVKDDPGNAEKSQKLAEAIKDIDPQRVASDPKALGVLSKAYSALGEYDTAEIIIDKAIDIDKTDADANSTKENITKKKKTKLEFDTKIDSLSKQVAALEVGGKHSGDKAKKVARTLTEIKPPTYVDDKSLLVVAQALHAVGDKQGAIATIDKVVESKPDSKEAIELKNHIINHTPETVVQPHVLEEVKQSPVMANKKALFLKKA